MVACLQLRPIVSYFLVGFYCPLITVISGHFPKPEKFCCDLSTEVKLNQPHSRSLFEFPPKLCNICHVIGVKIQAGHLVDGNGDEITHEARARGHSCGPFSHLGTELQREASCVEAILSYSWSWLPPNVPCRRVKPQWTWQRRMSLRTGQHFWYAGKLHAAVTNKSCTYCAWGQS